MIVFEQLYESIFVKKNDEKQNNLKYIHRELQSNQNHKFNYRNFNQFKTRWYVENWQQKFFWIVVRFLKKFAKSRNICNCDFVFEIVEISIERIFKICFEYMFKSI